MKTFGSSIGVDAIRAAEEHVPDQPRRGGVGRLADHGRGPVEARERVAQRLGAERSLAVRQVLRLVAVRVLDVAEVDVERRARLEHRVRRGERVRETVGLEELAVARRVHVREVEDGADEVDRAGDRDDVVDRPEVADAAHHLDAERDEPVLRLEPLAEVAELVDDVGDRVVALAAEEEAGMEDDQLRAARLREPGGVVEHPERHLELLAAVGVAHERRERRVDGERDVGRGGGFAEERRGVVVEPEAAGEAELARAVALGRERGEGRVEAVRLRQIGRAEADLSHAGQLMRVEAPLLPSQTPTHPRGPVEACRSNRAQRRANFVPISQRRRSDARPSAVRPCFYFVGMPKHPSRLDLLELDIDLRLTDLWRETADVSEWNLEVVAAFLRAAYGKGYCDALTEDAPGSLCHEHGYRIPDRAPANRAAEPGQRAA